MVSKNVAKKKTHEMVKQELLNSLKENDEAEDPGLNEVANETNGPGETIFRINQYEEIIKSHNKRVIGYVAKQGQILKKFREVEDFIQNVRKIKFTIYYKITKYPSSKKSTLPSSHFGNNFKAINTVC